MGEYKYFRIEAVEGSEMLGIDSGENRTAPEALYNVLNRRRVPREEKLAAERAYAAVGEASGYRVVEMSEQAWLILAEHVESQPRPEWPSDAGMSPSDSAALDD